MIAAALLLLAGQAATPAPDRFSVLWEPCPTPKPGQDVVVCGRRTNPARLPLPDERGPPDHPVPVNPDMTGAGALAAGSPCASLQGGCGVGIDLLGMATALVRVAQKAVSPDSCCEEPGEGTNPALLARDMVHGVAHAFARRPDRSNRLSIDLAEAAPPATAGRVLP